MSNPDVVKLLSVAAVLCTGVVIIEVLVYVMTKIRHAFSRAIKIIDAPKEQDTEFDRQLRRTELHLVTPPPPSRLYDQEKDGYI